jgi:hypothetical protein
MQSLLTTQRGTRPKRTFRNWLSGASAVAALSIFCYEWIVFPAANVRKDLQLTGMACLIISFIASFIAARRIGFPYREPCHQRNRRGAAHGCPERALPDYLRQVGEPKSGDSDV